jgi:hypothetical protein
MVKDPLSHATRRLDRLWRGTRGNQLIDWQGAAAVAVNVLFAKTRLGGAKTK